jgi:hypothetical protein
MREFCDERRAGCGGAEHASASTGGGSSDAADTRCATAGDGAGRRGAFFRATACSDAVVRADAVS